MFEDYYINVQQGRW